MTSLMSPGKLHVAAEPAVITCRCWGMGVQRVPGHCRFFRQPHTAVCSLAVSGVSGQTAACLPRAGVFADCGWVCGVGAAVIQGPLASLDPKHQAQAGCSNGRHAAGAGIGNRQLSGYAIQFWSAVIFNPPILCQSRQALRACLRTLAGHQLSKELFLHSEHAVLAGSPGREAWPNKRR